MFWYEVPRIRGGGGCVEKKIGIFKVAGKNIFEGGVIKEFWRWGKKNLEGRLAKHYGEWDGKTYFRGGKQFFYTVNEMTSHHSEIVHSLIFTAFEELAICLDK